MNKKNLKTEIKFLLKEVFLKEGYYKLPDDVSDKIFPLYNEIIKNYSNIIKRAGKSKEDVTIEFKDYFFIKDLKGNQKKVSIGFFNDKKNNYIMVYRTLTSTKKLIAINLNFFDKNDYSNFEKDLYHELVHVVDPLLNYEKINKKYKEKNYIKPEDIDKNYNKYKKTQSEIFADLSPFITKIKKLVGENDVNDIKLKWIIWLIGNIKQSEDYTDMFSLSILSFDNFKKLGLFSEKEEFEKFIAEIYFLFKPWIDSPKIMKKVLKDLYNVVKNK
jgi:hypothetical protein